MYSIHYLTGQNRGLSGLKNIWPVIMTSDLLSVIFSPGILLKSLIQDQQFNKIQINIEKCQKNESNTKTHRVID